MLHHELAWRLFIACKDDDQHRAEFCSSRELCDLAQEELKDTILLVVSPFECVGTSGNRSAFVSAFDSARKRILASVEPVGSPGTRNSLCSPCDLMRSST